MRQSQSRSRFLRTRFRDLGASVRQLIPGVVRDEYPSVRKRVALETNVPLESLPAQLPPRVERNLAIALEGGDDFERNATR